MGRQRKNIDQDVVYGKISTPKELGRLIRRKRNEIGVAQETAAGMAGVGTKFFSQLENGKETAELGKALQVLWKMGLDVHVYPRSADPLKERVSE